MIRLDRKFAKGYCEAIECAYLYIQSSRYKIRGKHKSQFCQKPELLREHMETHYLAGGSGVAKLVRGEESTIILESQGMHFVENGKAEIVSEKPLVIKLK